MKLISHRGNINGANDLRENAPDYLQEAIDVGYDVELDIRLIDGNLWLGHDEPQYEIDLQWLLDRRSYLWIHVKNIAALSFLLLEYDLNVFWHQQDDYAITSKKFIWTYPKKLLYSNTSVCVLPELGYTGQLSSCYGICSDYIEEYK